MKSETSPSSLKLVWHAVTRDVGNVRNQGDDLSRPVDPEREAKAGAALMSNWLKRGASDREKKGSPDEKKKKRSE